MYACDVEQVGSNIDWCDIGWVGIVPNDIEQENME